MYCKLVGRQVGRVYVSAHGRQWDTASASDSELIVWLFVGSVSSRHFNTTALVQYRTVLSLSVQLPSVSGGPIRMKWDLRLRTVPALMMVMTGPHGVTASIWPSVSEAAREQGSIRSWWECIRPT